MSYFYETTFTDLENSIYEILGCDYGSTVKAVCRKLSSQTRRFVTNMQNALVDNLSYDDTSLVVDQYSVKLSDVKNAINNDISSVPTIENPNITISVDSVTESVQSQINNSIAFVTALNALDEANEIGSDPVTLYQAQIIENAPDADSITMASAFISILSSSTLNLAEKAVALFNLTDMLKDADGEVGYHPEDVEYTTQSPFWILYGDLDLPISAIAEKCLGAWALRAKIVKGIYITVKKVGKKVWHWIKNWTSKNVTNGVRISLIDSTGTPTCDGKGTNVGMGFFLDGSDADKAACEQVNQGQQLVINVPGGYLILALQHIIPPGSTDPEDHFNYSCRLYFRPVVTKFLIELGKSGKCDPQNSNFTIHSFSELYDAYLNGEFVNDPRDYALLDADLSKTSVESDISIGLNTATWLFFNFCRALNQDAPSDDYTKFTSWADYSFSVSNLNDWKSYYSLNNGPSFQDNQTIAVPYQTSSSPLGPIAVLLHRMIHYIHDPNRSDSEWAIHWRYTGNVPSDAYHLSSSDELGEQAASAFIKVGAVVAIIVIGVVLAKAIRKTKIKLKYNQARIDQALFDPNLTVDDVADLMKQQRRIDLISKCVGLPASSTGGLLSSMTVTAKGNDDISLIYTRLNQIGALIK